MQSSQHGKEKSMCGAFMQIPDQVAPIGRRHLHRIGQECWIVRTW